MNVCYGFLKAPTNGILPTYHQLVFHPALQRPYVWCPHRSISETVSKNHLRISIEEAYDIIRDEWKRVSIELAKLPCKMLIRGWTDETPGTGVKVRSESGYRRSLQTSISHRRTLES